VQCCYVLSTAAPMPTTEAPEVPEPTNPPSGKGLLSYYLQICWTYCG